MFPMPRPPVLGLLVACLAPATSQGDTVPEPVEAAVEQPSATISIDDALRELALPLPDEVLQALRQRQWDRAVDAIVAMPAEAVDPSAQGDLAFVHAFALTHTDEPERALPLLERLDAARVAPKAYVALVKGEVTLAAGDAEGALAHLAEVPAGSVVWSRAAVQTAAALDELGRTDEAMDVFASIAERPDPHPGNVEALLALVERHGPASEEAYPLLRRAWAHYAGHERADEVEELLQRHHASKKPTREERSARAEGLMYAGAYDQAIALTEGMLPAAADTSTEACRTLYVRGRSYYKKNQLSNAVKGFADIGERCRDEAIDYGPRGLYLLGTAQFRRKQYTASANAYRLLADAYRDHSMADDALTRGGISLQEGGDLAKARSWWEEGLDAFPEGDTVPEATWRLAFSLYLDGKPGEAIAIAERLGALSLAGDATHVQAGRYWAARWLAYPDVNDPRRPTPDADALAQALEGFERLCVELPHSFYAILAHNRLRELDPARAARLAKRPASHTTGEERVPWEVRRRVFEHDGIATGVALARLGLVPEALEAWGTYDGELHPEEMAWLIELRGVAGDWLIAHDVFRDWLEEHPMGTLGPREAQILRLAYPDRYWSEVQAAVKDSYRYPARLFHGLVREESNFNRHIVSFAGARGLSQLMPATARQTAGWLNMTITMDDLKDPKTNLTIGARYLDAMHKQLADSPYLALAAYNGGAGNVNKWIGAYGNLPTDEFVERIPFRETRGYVKRVMGTWQTYRYRFDVDDEVFADLSAYNHYAKPER
jgi:soluble lytic murein transglycosylase